MGFITKKSRLIVAVITMLGLPLLANGQDLGSTSGLFRSKSSTKKSTPKSNPAPKKTAPSKPKSSTATSRKSSSSRTTSSSKKKAPTKSTPSKAESPSDTITKPQVAAKRPRKLDDDIVITVGDKPGTGVLETFENAISEGNTARNRRFYLEAESAYTRARKANPNDARAIYGLGNIYSDQQRWEEAETSYRMALSIEPNNPLASIALSYVLTQPVVGSNLGERYSQAEEIARNAIALDPMNAIGYDQLGVALELRGVISKETERAYNRAIELDPTFGLAYAHLGRLMRKQGRTSESLAAYREAIKLSVNVPTMILVADVMQSQQRFLDSEQLLREALRRDPRNPTGLYLLGRALLTRKNFDESEAALQKAVSISPRSFVLYTLLGSLYFQSGDLLKAEQTLDRATGFVSNNEKKRLSQEFEGIGDGYFKASRRMEAARVYRRAISLDTENAALPVKLANADISN